MGRDLGDLQTPVGLVTRVLECLGPIGNAWPRVLEPTCGAGSFIAGLVACPHPPTEIHGLEIQEEHLRKACGIRAQPGTTIHLRRANILTEDLRSTLQWNTRGPLLVVGNPPWVTNAELGALGSRNLPRKVNLKGLVGLDAVTGASNFDLAEYIWLKLIRELENECPTIALLCKTAVARRVVEHVRKSRVPCRATLYRIDARAWFHAAVDACLFRLDVGGSSPVETVAVYDDLAAESPTSLIGFRQRGLIADTRSYEPWSFADGDCTLTWRQGIKHDAASVMELRGNGGELFNKLGEQVRIEGEFVYPLVKGSDLSRCAVADPARFVIVPQRRLGEETRTLQSTAPLLWAYLTSHVESFRRRKSSIYVGRPPFSVFGVGAYSFAPYKVAVSGLHKEARFVAIGSPGSRPTMLDDTCYFVACASAEQAALVASLLESGPCQGLVRSLAFTDAKRPITKGLLQRVDLHALLERSVREDVLARAAEIFDRMGPGREARWPDDLEEALYDADRSPRQRTLLGPASAR